MAETTPTQDDWVANAANSILDVVDRAKTNGTDNAVLVIRGVVYGLVAAVFGIIATVISVVILVRMADSYLPIGSGVGDATWAAHLFIGALLTILGFGLWANRTRPGNGPTVVALLIDLAIIAAVALYGIIDFVS